MTKLMIDERLNLTFVRVDSYPVLCKGVGYLSHNKRYVCNDIYYNGWAYRTIMKDSKFYYIRYYENGFLINEYILDIIPNINPLAKALYD